MRMELLQTDGKRRFIDIPEDYFKDFKLKLTVDPTGEKKNRSTALQSLDNIFVKVASNPAILQNPDMVKTLNQMLEIAGLDYMYFKTVQPVTEPTGSNVPQGKSVQSSLQKQTETALPAAQTA